MKYNILWTDMHSNLHHEALQDLPKWYKQVQATLDFWPFAYYPYYMRKDACGMAVEDRYPLEAIEKDWEYIRAFTKKVNEEGYPMFMGYEWQGAGLDGDHNVFFKGNDDFMKYPLRYEELKNDYKSTDAIAIPHHLAYQLNHRGKNWETHDDEFSPFVETYSSHGSSENDTSSIEMNRHVHMGPRTGETTVEKGYAAGHCFGIMASGDNHSVPGVYGFGYMAVLAENNSKEAIWDAFINKRVYGVSQERIKLDFKVDDAVMGSMIKPNQEAIIKLNIEGSNAIDRIEIIKNNNVLAMIPHTSTWESKPLNKIVRVKFKVEMGWGPDRRIFEDIIQKQWIGSLNTTGKLISIEKCWSNFGQKLINVTDNSCDFECTSYKTTASGKWMGPSAITTEGFIFEIEDSIDAKVNLVIDGIEYSYTLRALMENSRVIPLMAEVEKLVKDRFEFETYYRSDPWWHNAYKIKIGQAVPSIGYARSLEYPLAVHNGDHIRVKVYQKNGSLAWSSPVFVGE